MYKHDWLDIVMVLAWLSAWGGLVYFVPAAGI